MEEWLILLIRFAATRCASYLLALAFLLPNAARSEASDLDVVAKVGNENITLDDLRRVEQRLRRFGSSQDKREFLQPFIDREILRIEAERIGLADVPEVLKTLDKIRRRQLAEKVYTKEVTDKISVSDLILSFRNLSIGKLILVSRQFHFFSKFF